MTVKYYKVGGYVRDEFIREIHGADYVNKSKDIDFAVEAESYEAMKDDIVARGCSIFLESPEFYTIRASHPTYGGVDYVLCRKDGEYLDGRHPETVSAGTLFDDLERRDFRMNAIALSEDGSVIDPFNGKADIENKLICCVGDPNDRFIEDSLRILRGIRFSIKLGFDFDLETEEAMARHAYKVLDLPTDRIREELEKCFMMNTVKTVTALVWLDIFEPLFEKNDLWLMPTSKERPYVKKQKSVGA